MKKITFAFTVLLLFIFSIAIGQIKSNKSNPFQRVRIPDSVYVQLESKYKEITHFDSVNAGKNVWNLLEPKNFVLTNSIYSFKGQGPHFPRLIFIYNNNRVFVLNAIGAFAPSEILQEYLKCINEFKLTNSQIRKYLKAISTYLVQEEGQTYGQEIK